MRRFLDVELSDGESIKIEYAPVPGQEVEVGLATKKLKSALAQVKSIAKDVKGILDEARPDKTTVEFGVEFVAEASGLTTLIAKGSAQANLKITLEWNKDS